MGDAVLIDKEVIGIILSAGLVRQADCFRQPEIVLTDDITIRNNAVILAAIPFVYRDHIPAVVIVQLMELVLRIGIQATDAIIVCRKQDDIDSEGVRIRFIIVMDFSCHYENNILPVLSPTCCG